jgi:Zn finger protein HypA/HybF involved in hydrogenase expression
MFNKKVHEHNWKLFESVANETLVSNPEFQNMMKHYVCECGAMKFDRTASGRIDIKDVPKNVQKFACPNCSYALIITEMGGKK